MVIRRFLAAVLAAALPFLRDRWARRHAEHERNLVLWDRGLVFHGQVSYMETWRNEKVAADDHNLVLGWVKRLRGGGGVIIRCGVPGCAATIDVPTTRETRGARDPFTEPTPELADVGWWPVEDVDDVVVCPEHKGAHADAVQAYGEREESAVYDFRRQWRLEHPRTRGATLRFDRRSKL